MTSGLHGLWSYGSGYGGNVALTAEGDVYAGQVVETAGIDELFSSPRHPYTAGMLGAVPSTETAARRLPSLPGTVPSLAAMPEGCRFANRCVHAIDACREASPPARIVDGHVVRCIRAHELDLEAR